MWGLRCGCAGASEAGRSNKRVLCGDSPNERHVHYSLMVWETALTVGVNKFKFQDLFTE